MLKSDKNEEDLNYINPHAANPSSNCYVSSGQYPPAKGTNGTQGSMNIGEPVVFGLRALFLVMELQPQSLRIKEKIL